MSSTGEDTKVEASKQTVKRTRNPVSPEVKQQLMEWFEKHREDIRYAKKGYIARVKSMFETETGHKLTDFQFRKLLELFRVTHNAPIEYVQNKYYTPHRNGYCMSNYVKASAPENKNEEPKTEQ